MPPQIVKGYKQLLVRANAIVETFSQSKALEIGFRPVAPVEGGFSAWKAAGGVPDTPAHG